jgi:DNA modification methylase
MTRLNAKTKTVTRRTASSKARARTNKLNDLTGREWIKETTSVWIQKGLGSGHEDAKIEREHPAPFSFQDVARLVRFFTKRGMTVLDPFCGVASTLKACALNGRHGIGIELSVHWANLGRDRLTKEIPADVQNATEQRIIVGDSREKLDDLTDESVDFIVTSPPYWNILSKIDHKMRKRIMAGLATKYSAVKGDLGNLPDYDVFLTELAEVFANCVRILRTSRYMCVIVSDFRHKSRFYLFHADLVNRLEPLGLCLKGIKILYQSQKSVFPYGYPFAYVPNIHHQYILIFQKVSGPNP